MSKLAVNRFVGARSYDEEDRSIFFGREKEAADLYQLVNVNTFTLLYGKSGLGKTSVLQAGLFPKLRAGKFLPIYTRLNYNDKAENFVEAFQKNLFDYLQRDSIEFPAIGTDQTIWEYFHESQFKVEGIGLTPVLVLDQFEEIFTLGTEDKSSELRNNTKKFIELIADLIENSPPASIPEEKRLKLQYDYSGKSSVKVIFSFREEYLGDFYELSKYIPSIAYSNLQYKLSPLTFAQGYFIIQKAGSGVFDHEAINEILELITESPDIESAEKRDVDSFILSVLCESLISKLSNSQEKKIDAAEIKGINAQLSEQIIYKKGP